jgi:hypothetical protein
LTDLISSKVKFEWHSSHQQAFDKVKKVIGMEVLLCYPEFNKPVLFHQSSCRIKAYRLFFEKEKYRSKEVYNH